MNLDILRTLNAERAARRAVIVVTDVEGGAQRLVKADEVARDFRCGKDEVKVMGISCRAVELAMGR